MSTKLSELAEKLDIPLKDLKEKINELGFELSSRARLIDDETAELVFDELSFGDEDNASKDVAEVYDEMISEQQEREIIKKQRKKTAGKDQKVSQKENIPSKPDDAPKINAVEIGDTISVKEFSDKTGIKAAKIIGELMKNGILANINQQIDFDTAQIVADDLGIKCKRIRSAAGVDDLMAGNISNLMKEDDSSVLVEKPPVVCVMGHVDHGKTQLLDTIREADVISGESGGITQHIGAYQVHKKGKLITFLDTPGHEAFTAMRARGAKVTDIAILIVSADEGVKPQTVEAYNHAKDAGVPIIVAINKIDKPDANVDKVKGELTEMGLQPEDWGGKTVTVPISALKGEGIDDLLDMILLTAEMENLKANPGREAVGTVVEAHLDQSLGPVATILINTGTLNVGDTAIVGDTYGRIKLMKDHKGQSIKKALPSTPVLIAGLQITPKSGDILHVVGDEKTARLRAEEVSLKSRQITQEKASGLDQVITRVHADKVLKIVLKADTKGSLEAIKQSIAKIKDETVAVKIIHSAVGTISESDIMMAGASKGVVMAFHAKFFSSDVKKTAERQGVEVLQYVVIYDLLENIKRILTGLLDAEIVEIQLGRAEVKQVFLTKKQYLIVGCRINSGKLENKAKLKVIRGRTPEDEDNIVGHGYIESLKKTDEVVKELGEGNECGIKFAGDVELEEGDILEAFKEEEKRRTVT